MGVLSREEEPADDKPQGLSLGSRTGWGGLEEHGTVNPFTTTRASALFLWPKCVSLARVYFLSRPSYPDCLPGFSHSLARDVV